MAARRNELLADAAATAAEAAQQHGVRPDVAEHIGAAIADTLAENWGGQVLSFPKDHAYKLSKREAEILEAHRNGATYLELMREYDMTERGIRKLLKRAHRRQRGLSQLVLFSAPD